MVGHHKLPEVEAAPHLYSSVAAAWSALEGARGAWGSSFFVIGLANRLARRSMSAINVG